MKEQFTIGWGRVAAGHNGPAGRPHRHKLIFLFVAKIQRAGQRYAFLGNFFE